jgi:hypothetical protein
VPSISIRATRLMNGEEDAHSRLVVHDVLSRPARA